MFSLLHNQAFEVLAHHANRLTPRAPANGHDAHQGSTQLGWRPSPVSRLEDIAIGFPCFAIRFESAQRCLSQELTGDCFREAGTTFSHDEVIEIPVGTVPTRSRAQEATSKHGSSRQVHRYY